MPGENSSNRFPDKITLDDVLAFGTADLAMEALHSYTYYEQNSSREEQYLIVNSIYTPDIRESAGNSVGLMLDIIPKGPVKKGYAAIEVVNLAYKVVDQSTGDRDKKYDSFVDAQRAVFSSVEPSLVYETLNIPYPTKSIEKLQAVSNEEIRRAYNDISYWRLADNKGYQNFNRATIDPNADLTSIEYSGAMNFANNFTPMQQSLLFYQSTFGNLMGTNAFQTRELIEEGFDYAEGTYLEKYFPDPENWLHHGLLHAENKALNDYPGKWEEQLFLDQFIFYGNDGDQLLLSDGSINKDSELYLKLQGTEQMKELEEQIRKEKEEKYKAFDDNRKLFRDKENNAQNDNYFHEVHLIDSSLARDINNVATKVLAMEGAGGRSLSTEEYLSMGIFSASEKEIFEALLEENGGIIDQEFLKKLNNIQDTLGEGTSKSGVAISEGSSAGSDVLINSGLYSDKDAKNNNESKQDDKVISNPPTTSGSHYSPIDYGSSNNKVVSNPPTTPTSHYSPGASGANQNKTLPIPPKYAKLLRQHEVEKAKADRMQQHGKTIMDNPEVRKHYQQPSTPTKKVSVSVRSTPTRARISSLAKAVDRRIARYL